MQHWQQNFPDDGLGVARLGLASGPLIRDTVFRFDLVKRGGARLQYQASTSEP
jgi:hypothetical protein